MGSSRLALRFHRICQKLVTESRLLSGFALIDLGDLSSLTKKGSYVSVELFANLVLGWWRARHSRMLSAMAAFQIHLLTALVIVTSNLSWPAW